MSSEAIIQSSLTINKDSLQYGPSKPVQFRVNVNGHKGPVPGAFTVSKFGTNVDLSQLVTPGLCRIANLDPTDGTGTYFEYGIYDPTPGTFYPLGECGPGESYVIKLTRNLQEEYTNTGTGTSAPVNYLRLKAFRQDCTGLVEAFEA